LADGSAAIRRTPAAPRPTAPTPPITPQAGGRRPSVQGGQASAGAFLLCRLTVRDSWRVIPGSGVGGAEDSYDGAGLDRLVLRAAYMRIEVDQPPPAASRSVWLVAPVPAYPPSVLVFPARLRVGLSGRSGLGGCRGSAEPDEADLGCWPAGALVRLADGLVRLGRRDFGERLADQQPGRYDDAGGAGGVDGVVGSKECGVAGTSQPTCSRSRCSGPGGRPPPMLR
jgi:hypothetical protein